MLNPAGEFTVCSYFPASTNDQDPEGMLADPEVIEVAANRAEVTPSWVWLLSCVMLEFNAGNQVEPGSPFCGLIYPYESVVAILSPYPLWRL